MHVLVTGATGGIGQGICTVLAQQAPQDLQLTVASTEKGERLEALLQALHSMGVQKQVRQAVAQGPQNAGPINSHMLTLRALVLLRERSPQYLERFMTHVDTLLCLEQSEQNRLLARKPKKTAKDRS